MTSQIHNLMNNRFIVWMSSFNKRQIYIRFFVISILGAAVLAFITSGSLISTNMSPVGVNPLHISAVVAAHLLLVLLLIQLLPRLFKKKAKQGRLDI